MVVPFGCSNATTFNTFMRLMIQTLQPLLGKCVVIYFDDIFIFSKDENEHLQHLRQVLSILEQNSLKLNVKKCIFLKSEVLFLGFLVGNQGVRMDLDKI